MLNLTKLARRTVLTAALSLAAVTGADAQAYVYVPDDTPATGGLNGFPFSAYSNWRFQILVPASELPNTPFKISNIAFAPAKTTLWTSPDFQIRIAHTTLNTLGAAFDANFSSPPIVCRDGAVNFDAVKDTWSAIGLTNWFSYNGTDNLVVELRYRSGPALNLNLHYTGVTGRAYRNSGPDPYTATYATGFGGGPKIRFNKIMSAVAVSDFEVALATPGPIVIGGLKAGQRYQLVSSFGQGLVPLTANLHLNVAADPLFWSSIFVGQPVFLGYAGVVPQQATSVKCAINVPNIQALIGTALYHAAVIYDSRSILDATNTTSMRIVRQR